MDELVVRILRTVACKARIRIMSRLSAVNEATPTELARQLRVRRDVLCVHLARLAAAGLILRRRSGARCYCAARSPYSESTLSGRITEWLRNALRPAAPGASGGTRAAQGGSDTAQVSSEADRAVFEAATAFTNVRRLQILRRLAKGKAADGPTLQQELKMSPQAVARHVGKLIRRAYVSATRRKRRLLYQLVPQGKTPLHARLLEIVMDSWEK